MQMRFTNMLYRLRKNVRSSRLTLYSIPLLKLLSWWLIDGLHWIGCGCCADIREMRSRVVVQAR